MSEFVGQEKPSLATLEHHGVKGMKWGVRHDPGHVGQKAKTKKIARLDKKFERDSQSLGLTAKVYNSAARDFNENHVDRINNKPAYKNADFTRDSPLRQRYNREIQKTYIDSLEKAASAQGTNASGTKSYGIVEKNDGSWDIILKDVKHDDTVLHTIIPKRNARGIISSLSVAPASITHESSDAFLAHYGIKGMKWGVRRRYAERQQNQVDTLNRVASGNGKFVESVRAHAGSRGIDLLEGKGQDGALRLRAERKQAHVDRILAGEAKTGDILRMYGSLRTIDYIAGGRDKYRKP